MKSKLNLQRKEYETIVKRHLGFIDKLLAEKEEVSKKCETLTDEVKSLEKQFNDKMKATEELHSRDVKQQKELWAAAEKIKRDKWISEQTKKIKETTVKGLEPEIQRMIGVRVFDSFIMCLFLIFNSSNINFNFDNWKSDFRSSCQKRKR